MKIIADGNIAHLSDFFSPIFRFLIQEGYFTQEELDRQKQKASKGWEMAFNNVERVGKRRRTRDEKKQISKGKKKTTSINNS